MFCRNCGKEIPEGSKFCPSCGTEQDVHTYHSSAPPSEPPPTPPSKQKKGKFKTGCLGIIGILIIMGIIGSWAGTKTKDAFSSKPSSTLTSTLTSTSQQTPQKKVVPPPTPSVPIEYRNALHSAEIYGKTMHMSKAHIYDQLTSEYGEKFSAEAAKYAIDNAKIDYKKEALASAKEYQSQQSMSRRAIYDQLVSSYGEQFTVEEAQYAIDHLTK